MVTTHEGGTKNPGVTSSQAMVLNMGLKKFLTSLGGFDILVIVGENMLTVKIKRCVVITD